MSDTWKEKFPIGSMWVGRDKDTVLEVINHNTGHEDFPIAVRYLGSGAIGTREINGYCIHPNDNGPYSLTTRVDVPGVAMQNPVTGEVSNFPTLPVKLTPRPNPGGYLPSSKQANAPLYWPELKPVPVLSGPQCGCCQAYYAKHQAYRAGCPECGGVAKMKGVMV